MTDNKRELADWHHEEAAGLRKMIADFDPPIAAKMQLSETALRHEQSATALLAAAEQEERVRGVVEEMRARSLWRDPSWVPRMEEVLAWADALTPPAEPAEQHLTWSAVCEKCGREWIGVYPRRTRTLECPGCGHTNDTPKGEGT